MSKNRITITFNGRTVYWDVPVEVSVAALQVMVQTHGPAKEDF